MTIEPKFLPFPPLPEALVSGLAHLAASHP